MLRDSKLGYGFVFVGLGLGLILTSLLTGPRWGIVPGIILVAVGSPFLLSAHWHEGEIGPIDWRKSSRLFVPSLEIGVTIAAICFVVMVVVNPPIWREASKAPSLPSKYRPPITPEVSKDTRPPNHVASPHPQKTRPPEPVQTAPPAVHPNPLDPYDGAPNSKVADDAIAEARRLQNSVKTCREEMAKAEQRDTDNHDTTGTMRKVYIWRTKTGLRDYTSDLKNLHTSLIYRLGVAERIAEGDSALNDLLDQDPHNFPFFNCWHFQKVGDYFYSLGTKLKARGD